MPTSSPLLFLLLLRTRRYSTHRLGFPACASRSLVLCYALFVRVRVPDPFFRRPARAGEASEIKEEGFGIKGRGLCSSLVWLRLSGSVCLALSVWPSVRPSARTCTPGSFSAASFSRRPLFRLDNAFMSAAQRSAS
ncbi:hypothetical protein DFH11DRAFT_1725439 [Phellopilus nigrolimitatus]|nr:hypothetical protein DFH11DRAFT_1725439 [Phellopilus nigrolimitatus]